MSAGTLYGVGVGPGDPDLITVKAVKVISAARVVAYFAKRGKAGNAWVTAEQHVDPAAERLALNYPYTVELSPRRSFPCDAWEPAEWAIPRRPARFEIIALRDSRPLTAVPSQR